MRLLLVGMTVASMLVTHDVGAVKPLDNTAEFLVGPFRMPTNPPVEGPLPARLQSLPHDRGALPKGVWLRFENFGADRYKGWSAQMQIDDQGNIFLVTHLGDATPEKITAPSWPAKPTQKLDAATLADLRKTAAAFAAGPAYRGHAGLTYAPVFVVTIDLDGAKQEIVLEGYENDFIQHLRRITQFAHATPLDGKAAKGNGKGDTSKAKPPARQPARKP
jgi:hypothetical protein